MKISIIIATYNSAKTVRDTLESVLSQTFKVYEYIIKDGGSTDATLDIAREYEPRFEGRMRIISERDKGIYDAMNKGIEASTGDIVGILNSDDFFSSNDVLETVAARFLEDPTIEAVYGDVHYVRADDISKRIRYYSSRHFNRKKMLMGYMPAHPSFYAKKECFQKYGTFDTTYKIAADFENLLRLIYIGDIKTSYIPKDFVTMREGGLSSSGFSSKKLIMKEHFRAFKENGIKYNKVLYMFRYLDKIYDLIKR